MSNTVKFSGLGLPLFCRSLFCLYFQLANVTCISILKPASKAILVFAQSASRDALYKKLKGGECIFDHLTRQTIQKARRTGFPVFHFDEGLQEGTSFGERLSGAMKLLFDKGFESLVVIGNDSPDLSPSVLREAFFALDHNGAVLGPSDDGGVYLIGLHRDHFEYDEFLDLPWRQKCLFKQMIFWIQSKGLEKVSVLKCKMDLDTTGDFRNWYGKTGFIRGKLNRLIAGLLHMDPGAGFQKSLRFPLDFYPFVRFNKGSPALSC